MNHIVITRDALNVGEINDKVLAESCGAISLFVGTTRDCFEGKKVISLEYEAYEPMALKQMEIICEELRQRWPDIVNIAICHRLGLVEVKEASVVIAISSPHRKSSLDAVSVAIEELKKRVPIWKKELYNDDGHTWKENTESGLGYRGKLDRFNASMCDIKDAHPLPSQLVQISASEDEIKRRIQCFVEKKRDEIDLCNIMDFTQVTVQSKINTDKSNMTTQDMESAGNENEYMTCARVNSTIVKQEYSKGHLRVKRVENDVGPQMRPDYLNTLDKLMTPAEKVYESNTVVKKEFKRRHSKEDSTIAKYPAIIERLQAIEEHINVPQLRKQDIYQRLKVIEDRILYLESISPEYRHFLAEKPLVRDSSNVFETYNDIVPTTGLLPYERKIYSASEIDTIIQSFDGRDTEQNFKSDKSL